MPDPIAAAALYGGRNVPVTLRDGGNAVVHLRLVKISEIGEYLDKAIDEREALKMCIEEPKGFDLDTLSDESYDALTDANLTLNFTRALAMKEREAARAEQTGKGIVGLMQGVAGLLQKFAPPSPSPADSPASKSST